MYTSFTCIIYRLFAHQQDTHTPTHVNTFNRGPLIVLPLFGHFRRCPHWFCPQNKTGDPTPTGDYCTSIVTVPGLNTCTNACTPPPHTQPYGSGLWGTTIIPLLSRFFSISFAGYWEIKDRLVGYHFPIRKVTPQVSSNVPTSAQPYGSGLWGTTISWVRGEGGREGGRVPPLPPLCQYPTSDLLCIHTPSNVIYIYLFIWNYTFETVAHDVCKYRCIHQNKSSTIVTTVDIYKNNNI